MSENDILKLRIYDKVKVGSVTRNDFFQATVVSIKHWERLIGVTDIMNTYSEHPYRRIHKID